MQCEACGGPCVLMGVLGRRLHGRCRDCGLDNNRLLQKGETVNEDGEVVVEHVAAD